MALERSNYLWMKWIKVYCIKFFETYTKGRIPKENLIIGGLHIGTPTFVLCIVKRKNFGILRPML